MPERVLVCDDEPNIRKVLAAHLKRAGYDVVLAGDGATALASLGKDGADLVITDLVMPGIDGLALVHRVVENHPDVPVIVITAHGSVDSAVQAMKAGAKDYVEKPFEEGTFTERVRFALGQRAREKLNVAPEPDRSRYQIIGDSPRMQEIYGIIEKVADTPSTILITGESGTGKELVASALHAKSSRRDKPFIKINCAAIPRELVESELFGYEKGAFTSAVGSKPGRFELADQGTLFLDEIAEIPPETQVKLLRALQESEFERVGGLKTIKVDIRLIAATNRDLKKEIAEGRFREDLYYRLAVVPIELPALRERRDDIPALTEFFLDKYVKRLQKRIDDIEDEAMAYLANYDWPGNIRELENVLERTVLFTEGSSVTTRDLPDVIREKSNPAAPILSAVKSLAGDASMKEIVKQAAAELEKGLIGKALDETGGNVTRAAKILKISRKSLQNKMKELGLREA